MEELPNDLINVALNKPATQSSLSNWSRGQSLQEDASGATAELLLDDYAFYTDLEPNPYWKVDLQQPYSISVVEILNRDTVDRFHNFRIETSIDDENYATSFIKLDENRVSNSAENPSQFTLNRPTIARFVKIVLHDTNFLHLRRVRVFGILTNSTSATQAIERLNIENKENKNDSTSDAFLIEASRLEQGDVTAVCQQISNFRLKDQAMQVAVLVLAYRYPLGLKALSHFFSSSPSFRMFVHVDQKVDIKPFVDNAAPSTVFLEDRSKVFWRGWTMIEATMRLIFEARRQGAFDRYLLISDDSIPLTSLKKISEALETSPDYFHLAPNAERAWRYDKFFMFDSESTQLRYTPSREFTDEAMERLERMTALRRRGKRPIAHYYQGSQWWALSATNIEKIIESWHKDIWLRESFEFSDAPDEGYFHQILGENGTIQSTPLMWVDWKANPAPKVFTSAEEFESVIAKNCLFLRKIDFTHNQLAQWLKKINTTMDTI